MTKRLAELPKEGKVYFVLLFEGVAHHEEDSMSAQAVVVGQSGSWSYCICNQEAGE